MGRPKGQTPEHVKSARDTSWKIRLHRQRVERAGPSEKTDAELIADALAQGRVIKLPDGHALNALKWPAFNNVKKGSGPL
jgi:hypothetical protein